MIPIPPVLIQAVGVVAVVAVVAGVSYYKGIQECEEERDAAIMTQALDAAENMRKANENLARVERERDEAMTHHDVKVKTIVKIKERYVQTTKQCDISPELERALDATSGVFNATTNRLSASSENPGSAPEQGTSSLASATILSAYGYCAEQLYELYDTYYKPLTDAVRTSHEIASEGAGYMEKETTP